MWKQAVWYGILLAAGTLALQWIDYQHMARAHMGDLYAILMATIFLGLGVFVGTRLTPAPRATAFDGNPQAQAALGISPREMDVLQHMAAGHSYKEIAQALEVSPNTVKTHVARLFDKLDAKRRTDAINKARQLGIVA